MEKNGRPYIICHMLSSVNGRISGSFFDLPGTLAANEISFQTRQTYGCGAVMNGAITCAEIYADGFLDEPSEEERTYPREDFRAEAPETDFVVCIDPEGTLNWKKNYIERVCQPRSHVIEVLAESAADSYIGMLRRMNISYIFCGRDRIDLRVVLRKLQDLFGIRKILVTGGGAMNWSLLEEGLMDELHLFVASAAEPDRGAASVFDGPGCAGDRSPAAVPLKLISAEVLDQDTLHLVYRR